MIVLLHSRLGEKLVKIFYVFAFQHHLDQKVIFFNQEIAAKSVFTATGCTVLQ